MDEDGELENVSTEQLLHGHGDCVWDRLETAVVDSVVHVVLEAPPGIAIQEEISRAMSGVGGVLLHLVGLTLVTGREGGVNEAREDLHKMLDDVCDKAGSDGADAHLSELLGRCLKSYAYHETMEATTGGGANDPGPSTH